MAALLVCGLVLGGCYGDESISGYTDAAAIWDVMEIDGQAFDAPAHIQFPEEGEVVGAAPCNRFFGEQSAPYPWVAFDGLAATRTTCPEIVLERLFLTGLEEMTLAEIQGDVMILSNDAGREMVFRRR